MSEQDTPQQAVTQGTLRTRDGRVLPLERTDVSIDVSGPVADVVLQQRFRNDGATPIEAVYAFPLPHDASVYRMQFRIADRIVQGVVQEKAEARRVYEQARSEGRAATLLEEDAPALFTLSVANVPPGAVIDVELAYQELVAYDDGHWRLVFPMVAPERYQDVAPSSVTAPTSAAGAPQTRAVGGVAIPPPRVPTGERPADVSLAVTLRADAHLDSLRCPSHRTETVTRDDGVTVRLAASERVPNRDFVLTWQAGDAGVRPDVRFERREGEAGTFLLTVTPSTQRPTTERAGGADDLKALRCGNCGGVVRDMRAMQNIPGLGMVVPCGFCGAVLMPGTEVITKPTRPRDVLILVDRSASMRSSLAQASRAVLAVLAQLGPGDAVQLVAFDHDRSALLGDGTRWVPLSPELVGEAQRFLGALTPRGGTELEAVLEHAPKVAARDGRTRSVVLVTDAAVGNEGRLLRRIPELLGASTRLYVLGVGASVDRRLVARMARVGGGGSDVLLPNEDVEVTVTRFARRVCEGGPVLTGITLWWEGAGTADVVPSPIPDLLGGEALRVLGRYQSVGPTKLVITATTADGKPFRQEVPIDLPAASAQAPGIGRLWARRRIEAITEEAQRDPAKKPGLDAEGLSLSLKFGVVGPYTSLVAEDSVVSAQKVRARKARLVVVRGDRPGRAVVIDRTRWSVGRGSGADTTLDAGSVSRLHFELLLDAEGYALRDADSTNGTRVDGHAVRVSRIASGATIEAGDVTLRFELLDGPDAWFEYLPTQRVVVPMATVEAKVEAPAPWYPSDVDPMPVEAGASFEGAASFDDAHDDVLALEEDRGGGGRADRERASSARASGDENRAKHASESHASYGAPPPMPAAMPAPARTRMAAPAASGPAPAAPPSMGAAPAMGGLPSMGAMPPLGPLPPLRAPAPMGAQPPLGASPGAPPPHGAPFSMPRPPSSAPMIAPAPPPPPPSRMSPPASFEPPPLAAKPVAPSGAPRGGPGVFERVASASTSNAPSQQAVSPIELPGSEPYDAQELVWLRDKLRGELDLVFLVDETGSMGEYIAQVQSQLLRLVEALRHAPLCRDLRLGMVTYRDHPPQDATFASRVFPLTRDVEEIRRAVESLKASGGGDGPESVTDGLFDVVRLDWRPGAAKAVVWFGDAPPHGVEPTGDAFPTGCPCGHHWFAQAESCREMGVTIYAIGCLPTLRAYVGAEAVYRTVAKTSRGVFLPLREASLLVPLIAGAAVSELDRQRLDAHVADVVQSYESQLAQTDEPERVRWITQTLRTRGVRARDMAFDPESPQAAPMRFRDVAPRDVEGALDRLRGAQRVAV